MKEEETARVSCCEYCCLLLRQSNLILLNVLDLAIGSVMIAFSCYLYLLLNRDFSNSHLAWLEWGCAIIGSILIVTAMTSCFAVTTPSCRGIISISSYFGLFVAILCIILATLSFILRKEVFDYLRAHREQFDIGDDDLQRIEYWYFIVACAQYMTFILQLLRRFLSKGYRAAAERSDNEYVALMAEEDALHQETLLSNANERRQKYADLRDYYRTKYNIRSSREIPMKSDQESDENRKSDAIGGVGLGNPTWYRAPDDNDVIL